VPQPAGCLNVHRVIGLRAELSRWIITQAGQVDNGFNPIKIGNRHISNVFLNDLNTTGNI